MRYLFMNKNNILGVLNVDRNFVGVVSVHNKLPNFIGDIQSWIYNRSTPIGRANIDYLLKLAGIDSKEDYLSVTYGISLTDTFWFKPENSSMTWERISPYRNRFSRVISEICLNGEYKYDGELRSPSPDYKVDGSIDKCWKHINNGIYLFKTAGECWSGVAGLRTYMEYYANQVADALISDKSHFIKYGIKVAKTANGFRKPYVYSKIMTNESYGLLHYCDSPYRNETLDSIDNILPNRDRKILREMLVLDALIMNCDRHTGNYGFLINNDTYELLGLSPIYDNDCSLGFHVSLQSVDTLEEGYIEACKKQPRTEMGNYIDQARWAMTKELYNNIIQMRGFKFKRLNSKFDIDDNRIEYMEYIVNRQIDRILSTYKR